MTIANNEKGFISLQRLKGNLGAYVLEIDNKDRSTIVHRIQNVELHPQRTMGYPNGVECGRYACTRMCSRDSEKGLHAKDPAIKSDNRLLESQSRVSKVNPFDQL